MSSAIHFASNGDIQIAYKIVGSGPPDLIFIHGHITNLDITARGSHALKGVRTENSRSDSQGGEMEVHPGIFVSSTGTQVWNTDAEVGGEMHVLVESETAYVGMSRFRDVAELERWTLPERETVLIIEGAARIEIEDGPTLELKVGDMASMPKGAVTTWHLTVPFKEMWFFGRPYEMKA